MDDGDTVLISVLGDGESAIWSSQTGFAEILSQFIDAPIEDVVQD
ncbi:hypothetical protein [Haladaptatus sp. DFWS20]